MSHAIVATPFLVQVAGPGALAAAATTVLIPVLIGATMATIVAAVAKASEKERTCCATYLRHDLNQSMDRLEARYMDTTLSPKMKQALAAEMAEIRRLPESISMAITSGRVVQAEAQRLKDRIESLDLKISQAMARHEESKKSEEYLSGKVKALWHQAEAEIPDSQSAPWSALKEEWQEAQSLPDEDRDEKIERFRHLTVKIGTLLDRRIMKRLAQTLAAQQTSPVAPTPSTPPPAPSSPADSGTDLFGDSSGPEHTLRRLRENILELSERLREIAPDQLTGRMEQLQKEAATSDFLDRVKVIADEFRMTFQKAHEQRFLDGYFRDKLQASLTCLPPTHPLGREVQDILAGGLISRKNFDDLWIRLETELSLLLEREKREVVEKRLRESLEKLDYVVTGPALEEALSERLAKGEVCRLETKYRDYHLLLKLAPEGSLVLRLVKVVESAREKENVSDFQRQKDGELMKEWCKSLDAFKDHLMEVGIVLIEDIRLEDKIDYLTIEQLEQQKIDTTGLHPGQSRPKAPAKPASREKKR
jgi:hypothetical protein